MKAPEKEFIKETIMKNYLPCYEKSFCERTEKNVTCEIDLQEYLPNASKLVKVNATAVCEKCEVLDDSVNVRGYVKFSAVYLSDFRDRLKCASGQCEFSHSFPARDIRDTVGDQGAVECTVLVYDEKGQVLSPRKLSASCKAVISVQAVTAKRSELFVTEDSDNIHKCACDVEFMERKVLDDCSITLGENIEIEEGMPEIREIVSCECCVSSVEAVCRNEKADIAGKVLISCLYLGGNEGEEEYISFSKELDFSKNTDADGMPDGSFVICSANVTDINAEAVQNNYGDIRICSVNTELCISSVAFGVCKANVICDAFCTTHEYRCETKNISYDRFVCGTHEKIHVSENVRANLGSMTDIVSKSVDISVISAELSGKVPVFNMRAILRVMGTNEQGAPECVNVSFPIKAVSAKELSDTLGRCRNEAQVYANSCECRIENGGIVCDLVLEVCSCIYTVGNTAAITAMVIDRDTELVRDKSEYILYYPDTGDTVWSCAKKYRVSPSKLITENELGLSEADLCEKRVLVIPSSEK